MEGENGEGAASSGALLSIAVERTQHLRHLRDACREGQDVQATLWEDEGEVTWTLLESAFAAWTSQEDLTQEDKANIRRLLLAGLQLFNNLVAGNAATSSALWARFRSTRFLDLLEWSSKDRGLLACTCACIHTCMACVPYRQAAVKDLLSSSVLYCKLLRVTIPPGSHKQAGVAEGKEEDPVFEWVYFIMCKVLEAGEGRQAIARAGLHHHHVDDDDDDDDDHVDMEASLATVTPEQLILLHLLEHVVTDGHHHHHQQQEEGGPGPSSSSSPSSLGLLRSMGDGALCLDLVSRLRAWLRGPMAVVGAKGEEEEEEDVSRIAMAEAAAALVVKILASVLAKEDPVMRDRLVAAGAVGALVDLLRRSGGRADGVIPRAEEMPDVSREGNKTDVIRALGNLCHGCRRAQDEVRNQGGILLLLNHCNVDSSNPFLREWSLFTVRNVCEGNDENQRCIEALKPQETIATATLREMGLETYLKNMGEEEGGGGGGRVGVGVRKAAPSGDGSSSSSSSSSSSEGREARD